MFHKLVKALAGGRGSGPQLHCFQGEQVAGAAWPAPEAWQPCACGMVTLPSICAVVGKPPDPRSDQGEPVAPLQGVVLPGPRAATDPRRCHAPGRTRQSQALRPGLPRPPRQLPEGAVLRSGFPPRTHRRSGSEKSSEPDPASHAPFDGGPKGVTRYRNLHATVTRALRRNPWQRNIAP